jgi:hypothetical protein
MALAHSPSVVTAGLIACLDAGNTKSYPGSGTTITDLTGNAHGTINGTVSFVSAGPASYFNFATGSDSNFISSSVSQQYLDLTVVFQPDFSYAPGTPVTGLVGTGTPVSNLDKSLRISTGNPWTLRAGPTGLDGNDWGYPSTTYYLNGVASTTAFVNVLSGWNIIGAYRPNQSSFPLSFAYHLGSSAFSGRSFQGRIAYVAFYNRKLTAAEHIQNFGALRGRFGL